VFGSQLITSENRLLVPSCFSKFRLLDQS